MFSIMGRGGVVLDAPVIAAMKLNPAMLSNGKSVGDILAGVIEFLARDEIHRGRGRQRARRVDRDLGADHADHEVRDSRSLSSSATRASFKKEGALVCMMTRS